MERRKYLATTGALLGSALAGCSSDTPSNTDTNGDTDTTQPTATDTSQAGMLSTAVSDQPADIEDFETLEVSIEEIWVFQKGAEGSDDSKETDDADSAETEQSGTESTDEPDSDTTDTDSTPKTNSEIETEESETETPEETDEADGTNEPETDGGDNIIRIDAGGATADLVQLQGDAQQVISSEFLPVGTYEQIKLFVSDDVNAVLNDGSQADVMTPGNAPLQFKQTFDIRENTRTTFTADFAPVKRGPNGYVLKPVATETKVAYSPIENSTPEPSDEPSGTSTGASTDTAATDPGTTNGSETPTPSE